MSFPLFQGKQLWGYMWEIHSAEPWAFDWPGKQSGQYPRRLRYKNIYHYQSYKGRRFKCHWVIEAMVWRETTHSNAATKQTTKSQRDRLPIWSMTFRFIFIRWHTTKIIAFISMYFKQVFYNITRSLVSCLHFLVILSVYCAALSKVSWFLMTSIISSSSLTFSRYSLSICLRRLSISCPRCIFSCITKHVIQAYQTE